MHEYVRTMYWRIGSRYDISAEGHFSGNVYPTLRLNTDYGSMYSQLSFLASFPPITYCAPRFFLYCFTYGI